jgi:hypothetical protein
LIAYIEERYPVAGGWQAFDCQAKIVEALKAQAWTTYLSMSLCKGDAPEKRRLVSCAGDIKL